MAFSEKLVALASLFLDTVRAVERKPFFIEFQLGMLDPPGKGCLSRFLLELMSGWQMCLEFQLCNSHRSKM